MAACCPRGARGPPRRSHSIAFCCGARKNPASPNAANDNVTEPTAPALAPTAPWVVVKFGGTSVSTRPRWENIRRIAAAHRARGRRVLIVVSALSGITDRLKAIAESRDDDARCATVRADIVARHEAMFGELGLSSRAALDHWLAALDRAIADPRRRGGEVAWQASVFALGELMSSTLGAAFLSEVGTDLLPTVWLDAREYLHAEALPNQNAWGRYLSASVAAVPDPGCLEGIDRLSFGARVVA